MTDRHETDAPKPKIGSINNGEAYFDMDPSESGSTLSELDIPDNLTERTTVLVDGKSRLGLKGIAYPSWMQWYTKRRFPEHKDTIDGPVIRLSAVMKGKPRTREEIEKTFVHEAEHVAQESRKDRKVRLGHLAIYGGALAGALGGNILARRQSPAARIGATLAGAAVGRGIGYRHAPHEEQARQRSTQVTTQAVKMRR